jgi:hypothetical protein
MSKTTLKTRRSAKVSLGGARWAGYAASGATALLGFNEAARAEIVSGHLGVTLDACHGEDNPAEYAFDADGDGNIDLTFGHRAATTSSGAASVWGSGFDDDVIVGGDFGFPFLYAYNLTPGVLVDQNQPFVSFGFMASYSGFSQSEFTRAGIGYIGFSFESAEGGTHYGWVQVDMTGAPHNAYTLLDYAYEDLPDTAIPVGTVPEPGSLGLLATGAIGLLFWRRKRRQVKTRRDSSSRCHEEE